MRHGADKKPRLFHLLTYLLMVSRPCIGLRFSKPAEIRQHRAPRAGKFLGPRGIAPSLNVAVLYSEPAHFRSHRLVDMGIAPG